MKHPAVFPSYFPSSLLGSRVQVGHKGSEKEIRTHRTTEEGGTKVKMKLTSRDLKMNEVQEISLHTRSLE